jgi:RNA polymerase sigma-70 factor (sigma-E family)
MAQRRKLFGIHMQLSRAGLRMYEGQGVTGGSGGSRRLKESVREREFREFTEARQSHLRRSAYLLCGDWHQAQDLTQTTLMKLYAAWGRVRRDGNVEAYARTILTRTFIDQYRKKRWREEPMDDMPDVPSAEPIAPELRLVMQSALMQLPPRYRAVLVLRFWEDWSIEQTAKALRVTPGTVKSQSTRGLARLRRSRGGLYEGSGGEAHD